jgi:hypothetical protein
MIFSGLLIAAAMIPTPPQDTTPLFAANEPIELSILADFDAIRSDRADDPEERPALVVLSGEGGADTVEAQLRPRGDSRRDPSVCSFPPLRLNLKKKQTRGTVFDGQDKLKMVVPCRPQVDAYEQYVLLEYLSYRSYGLLTDASFRVRLARITFADILDDTNSFTRYAFFIEDGNALAERLGGEILDIPEGQRARPAFLDPRQATLGAVFQYMIGNTDWSDDAAHNVELVQAYGAIRPVPYDFDYAGLLDTPYATPDPLLGLTSVTERLYRGWCLPGVDPETVLRTFRDQRRAVEALLQEVPALESRRRREALDYLAAFWESIETSERAERRMFRDCRAVPN